MNHLTAALVVGVEEVLVVLVGREALVDDEDNGGDEDEWDEQLAVVDAQGRSTAKSSTDTNWRHAS